MKFLFHRGDENELEAESPANDREQLPLFAQIEDQLAILGHVAATLPVWKCEQLELVYPGVLPLGEALAEEVVLGERWTHREAVVDVLQEGQRSYDVLVRYDEGHRTSMEALRNTPIDTPSGLRIPLRLIADVSADAGPSAISRENAQRKVVVMANAGDADLSGLVGRIRAAVDERVPMPAGVYLRYGGQFESEQAARRRITMLGAGVILGIFALLAMALASWKLALLTMANLPLALIGGIASVFLGSGVLSVGSLIGFITLFGIATRNGLIMISHFEHLQHEEGASFDDAVERGSLERLSPVLMTALSAALALVPLVIAGKEPGNEIQAPMGVVILGGLLTSTLLNLLVIPALYKLVARSDR